MKNIKEKLGFICDMDGVIYHGNKVLDGVVEFITWMQENNKKFVFLTNSSERTPHELSMKLARMGLQIPPENFYTSAMATAEFFAQPEPRQHRIRYRRSRADQSALRSGHLHERCESGLCCGG